MVKRLLYTLFSFLLIGYCFGQDPTFSQFYANRLYLNPAFAGTAKCPRLTLNYRNQWPGIDNSFVTYTASYDQQVDAVHGGIGIQLLSDVVGEGVLQTTSAGFLYSYQLSVTRKFSIRSGIKASYTQKALDVSNLRFGDMIDARRGFVYQTRENFQTDNVSYLDIDYGILGFSDKFYFGAAVAHLTQPDEGFIKLSEVKRKYTGHFGAILPLGMRHEDMSWSPNFIYQQQGGSKEINVGLYLSKGPLVLGIWNRLDDSFIFLLGVQQDNFKIGYSYDMTTSLLSDKSAGSHEISFSYIFPCRPKKVKFQTISCPSF